MSVIPFIGNAVSECTSNGCLGMRQVEAFNNLPGNIKRVEMAVMVIESGRLLRVLSFPFLSSRQVDLYDETFRPIVDAVLEGYNGM